MIVISDLIIALDSLAWVLEVLHVQPILTAVYLLLISPYVYLDAIVKIELVGIP